jgi:hypothetical protein
MDRQYKAKIDNEWKNLTLKIRQHITNFLKRLGYGANVYIDEYQAYRYTERANFFGIKI